MNPVCSGKQFLAALTTGYEIGIRAGLIRHACYETFHSSGSWGAVAGAAAAGKIMGLDRNALRSAMGAAECHAPIAPMMKGIENPAMTKDAIGWGAMVAMVSVCLAQREFTAIEPMFNDTPREEWIENMGKTYEILNLYFKPYAACRWAQPAISGALKIVKQHGTAVDDIARIDVRTFKEAALLRRAHPENTEQAQYNLAFPVAAAIIDGELGPKQILPPRIFASEVLDLADKVYTEVSAAFDRLFPEKTLAEVVVRTKRGDAFSSGAVEAAWEPPNNVPSDAELEAKFRRLVTPILGSEQTHRLCSLIWHFENCNHINELIELCVKT
jgi:2-methylcitrate dehydratase PrpD